MSNAGRNSSHHAAHVLKTTTTAPKPTMAPCKPQPVAHTTPSCRRGSAARGRPPVDAMVPFNYQPRFHRRPGCTGRSWLCRRSSSGFGRRNRCSGSSHTKQSSPRHSATHIQHVVLWQQYRHPHYRRWRPPYLMQRGLQPLLLRSEGVVDCRGPATTTKRCTGLCMRCPALAWGVSPRGRGTPAARVGSTTPLWSAPLTRAHVPVL